MAIDDRLRIVAVELVEGDFIGIILSDDTAVLISMEEITSLGLPTFTILQSETGSDTCKTLQ